MFLFKRNFMCEVGREQNFILNGKYDKLLSFHVKIAISTDFYDTFRVIYVINIVNFLHYRMLVRFVRYFYMYNYLLFNFQLY